MTDLLAKSTLVSCINCGEVFDREWWYDCPPETEYSTISSCRKCKPDSERFEAKDQPSRKRTYNFFDKSNKLI